ncbi:MAG: class I SAM-dependent methyltransferase [Thermoplasmata archaeon]
MAGASVAAQLPQGYHRMGRVLLLRLPASLHDHFRTIGEAYARELGVTTVLRQAGPVVGPERRPTVEVLVEGPTETEVVEHGLRFRFDARRIMFATGNRTERQRAGRLVRPGETVIDLFAGIGYFAIPAALVGRAERVLACEINPEAVRFLKENVALNGVDARVTIVPGDNRLAPLASGEADRVFLGYLPTSLPWIPRALRLLRPTGGWLHVHLVADVRGGVDGARTIVERHVACCGGDVRSAQAREVKPYGPGRFHAVVDVKVGRPDRP